MSWPGPTAAAGASLRVRIDKTWEKQEYKDWWGLFRLLAAGEVTQLSPTEFHVAWKIRTQHRSTITIQYDLKSRTHKNPFRPGLFRQFRCISHL